MKEKTDYIFFIIYLN